MRVLFVFGALWLTGCGDDDDSGSSRDDDAGARNDDDSRGDGGNDDADDDDIADDDSDDDDDAGVTPDDSDAGPDDELADAGPRPDPITLAEFCEAARQAWTEACQSESPAEDCEAAATGTNGEERCRTADAAIESGRLDYDGVKAAECVEQSTLLSSVWEFGSVTDPACRGIFLGTADLGDDCYPDESFEGVCAEGYCQSLECPGTCTAYAEIGDDCTQLRCSTDAFCEFQSRTCQEKLDVGGSCAQGELCKTGLSCLNVNGTLECIAPRAEDEECDAESPCNYGLVCSDGVCISHADEGDVCGNGVRCPDSLRCNYDLESADETRRCQAPATLDEACDIRDAGCAEGLNCVADEGSTVGVCRSLHLGLNQVCSDELGGCEPDLYCQMTSDTEGTCQPDRGMGENCNDMLWLSEANSPCAAGLHCMFSNTGTCLPPGAEGDPCYYNDNDSCESGLFCAGFVGSVCAPPAALDERCNLAVPETSCAEGYCQTFPATDCQNAPLGDCLDFACRPRLMNGEPCEDPQLCESGYCNFSLDEPVCQDEVPPPEVMACIGD